MNLGDYLVAASMRRHELGVWDCLIFPADWIGMHGHPDPMAGRRGTYHSEAEGEGRLVELFSDALEPLSLGRPVVVLEGDVGVISLLGRQAGAIFTGRRWALIAERGLAFASVPPECVSAVWRP